VAHEAANAPIAVRERVNVVETMMRRWQRKDCEYALKAQTKINAKKVTQIFIDEFYFGISK
jgi:hypothetical protein